MIVKLHIGDEDSMPWLIDGAPPNVGETVWLTDPTRFPSTQKYMVVKRELAIIRVRNKDIGSYEVVIKQVEEETA